MAIIGLKNNLQPYSEGPLPSCLAIILQYNAGNLASNIGRGQIPEGLFLLSPDEKDLWLG